MMLIDLYMKAVENELIHPEAKTILEEIRNNITDQLGENPSDEEIEAVLNEMGDPKLLALNYIVEDSYIIGPSIFDIYFDVLMTALKLSFILVLTISFLSEFIDLLINFSIGNIFALPFIVVFSTIHFLLVIFVVTTIAFFVLEKVLTKEQVNLSYDYYKEYMRVFYKYVTLDKLKTIFSFRPTISTQKFEFTKSSLVVTTFFIIVGIIFNIAIINIPIPGGYVDFIKTDTYITNPETSNIYLVLILIGSITYFVMTLVKYIVGKYNKPIVILETIRNILDIYIWYLILIKFNCFSFITSFIPSDILDFSILATTWVMFMMIFILIIKLIYVIFGKFRIIE